MTEGACGKENGKAQFSEEKEKIRRVKRRKFGGEAGF